MVFKEGVLRDYLTELRTAQTILGTEPELTGDHLDQIDDCLNRCELLVLSLLAGMLDRQDYAIGVDITTGKLNPSEASESIQSLFNHSGSGHSVVLPDDFTYQFDEVGGDLKVSEEDKFSADDEPLKKS